jgi:uncharacterized membrane protein (GlpM family)
VAQFLIKLAVTVIVVVGLTEVSRRLSPTLAGILSGLPLGAALTMYFVATEQGDAFALTAVPWGILGISSSILFSLVYLCTGRLTRSVDRRASVIACVSASLAAFFGAALVFRLLPMSLCLSLGVTLPVIAANFALLRWLGIGHTATTRPSFGYRGLLFRAAVAGAIVTTITGAAAVLGSEWIGLLSGFPVILLPLYIVLHLRQGDRLYPGVIAGFSYSVTNLVLFYVSLLVFVPMIGLNLSFVVTYVLSGLYLWALNAIKQRFVA